jgi:hypothetical protein
VLSYRATLDVPIETVARVSRWIQAHRQRVDARPWQRAATCWTQAVLVLRWLKDDTDVHLLARDARISQATAYRYLHEAIDVIAQQAPDLTEVLAAGRAAGWAFVALDGTLIETSRSSAQSAAGHDIWYSGKHHAHGGNIQVVADPSGYPVWTSPVEPGSTHDITCARAHAFPALYPAAAAGLPTLTDKGYTGAGIGIEVSPSGARTCPSTTWPGTCSSPRYARPPSARTHCSNPPSRLCAGSPCAHGESATSPPPRSSSSPCNEAAGEKTSVCGRGRLRWGCGSGLLRRRTQSEV